MLMYILSLKDNKDNIYQVFIPHVWEIILTGIGHSLISVEVTLFSQTLFIFI